MEERCNDDRRILRREIAHRTRFVVVSFVLPNSGDWSVDGRGGEASIGELAPARGEGAIAARLHETGLLLLSFYLFGIPHKPTVDDAVDMAWPRKRHSSPFSRNTNSVSLVYNTAKILPARIYPRTKIKVSFLSPEQTTHLSVCFGDISISKCRSLKLPHSQVKHATTR